MGDGVLVFSFGQGVGDESAEFERSCGVRKKSAVFGRAFVDDWKAGGLRVLSFEKFHAGGDHSKYFRLTAMTFVMGGDFKKLLLVNGVNPEIPEAATDPDGGYDPLSSGAHKLRKRAPVWVESVQALLLAGDLTAIPKQKMPGAGNTVWAAGFAVSEVSES